MSDRLDLDQCKLLNNNLKVSGDSTQALGGSINLDLVCKALDSLIAEVERLRSHQGWDTENRKLQSQLKAVEKERDELKERLNDKD